MITSASNHSEPNHPPERNAEFRQLGSEMRTAFIVPNQSDSLHQGDAAIHLIERR